MDDLAAGAPTTDQALDATLRVTEVFHSLQGETSRSGLPTVFVRLTGCPLRCGYCDTAYAFHGGASRTLREIVGEVARHRTRYVCVTGGEPLAQKNCNALLSALADRGYSVSLETSGALDVSRVDPRISRIVDLKTPGSGEVEKNRWDNLAHLSARDELKLVLCNEADYLWARTLIVERALDRLCPVLLSPVHGELDPALLAEWILRDELPVRLQVQLHKVLWGNAQGR